MLSSGYSGKRRYACMALFFMLLALPSWSQYFQQEVNYTITAKLDDKTNSLRCREEIIYVNNSPKTLDTIYFHLWPNAYSSPTTALARQMLLHGNLNFYYAKPEQRGRIDSLEFKVNDETIRWDFYKGQSDICYLLLNHPLKSGDSLRVSTPFFLQIPDASFSRLGHTGQAYFITQWYPKPAVFDREGWHPMNYLDQGEFYSEYGSFDVSITLPRNYLLAATGDRIDADEEIQFLESKLAETDKHIRDSTRYEFGINFPPSAENMKTVRFRQYRVHDFAWFADKRFYVQKSEIELPSSGRKVDTWVFFTGMNFNLWKNAVTYVNESTVFYSYLLGDYPYNHVTAVDGTIMAGGGMEYPNITVIGGAGSAKELDMVITHEVGHNWFYGVLGSNERDHPFMDEGLNSLYELRYVRAKYGDKMMNSFINRDSSKLLRSDKIPSWKYHELLYNMAMSRNSDQSLDLPSEEYSEGNYGAIVYSKTAVIFDYLMYYLGEDNFNSAMRNYYSEFRFKHPQPDDLFASLEKSTGKDLSWFRRELLKGRNRVDYKIKKVKHLQDGSWTVTVKNKTASSAPFVIHSVKNGEITGQLWTEPKGKIMRISFPPAQASLFTIDAEERIPEFNRHNNRFKTKGIFRKTEPLQFNFITAFDMPSRTQVNFLPLAGCNYYNGLMVALAVHNYGLYEKKFEYALVPFYGYRFSPLSGSPHSISGIADVSYNFLPLRGPRQLSIGAHFKSFYFGNAQRFIKISPAIEYEFKKRPANGNGSRVLSYTSNLVRTDSTIYPLSTTADVKSFQRKTDYFVNQLSYRYSNKMPLHPYSFNVNLQHNLKMAKVYGSFETRIKVSRKNYLGIRAFAGAFVSGSAADRSYFSFRASGYSGRQDYLFEGNFYRRDASYANASFGQFLEKDGAMKVYTPLGQSTAWMVALNLKSPKAGKLPLRIFADAVFTDGRSLLKDPWLWDAGINLVIAENYLELYLPLVYSNDVKDVMRLNSVKWFQTFRFTLNIHKLEPNKILQSNFL